MDAIDRRLMMAGTFRYLRQNCHDILHCRLLTSSRQRGKRTSKSVTNSASTHDRHLTSASESILSTMNFERVTSYTNDDEVLSGSYKSESSFGGSDLPMRQHHRRSTSHNPTVSAMLRSNMMRDCVQVTEMYHHCVDSKADSTICKTAKQYFQSCSKK